MQEEDFENILAKYQDIIEKGLKLTGRQLAVHGRRIDLLFEDRFGRKLLVELKVGPIRDDHIGQLLSYEGTILSGEDPTLRVMLIGNRVPANIQRSLDHHGIAWREITIFQLKETLLANNDRDMLQLLEQEEKGLSLEATSHKTSTNSIRLQPKSSVKTKRMAKTMDYLFGSDTRAKLLGWLFTHQEEAFYVRQLSAILKDDPGNISRELSRLERLGILNSNRVARLISPKGQSSTGCARG